jgi:hypothetical protein
MMQIEVGEAAKPSEPGSHTGSALSAGRALEQAVQLVEVVLNISRTRHILRPMGMRLCGVALVALLLVTGAVSQASGLRDYVGGSETTLSTADDALLADLSKYYRIHANVRLGREQRLGNGVAWRLLTDVRTGAAVPRITWMTDRKSLLKANALFDALHGEALVGYDIEDLERRRMELYEWHNGRPPDVTKPPYFVLEKVALTYATSRLVSYVEVSRQFGTSSMSVAGRGLVLDLERGQIKEIEGCRSSDDYWRDFRLGEWFEVCGEAAYKSFMALYADKIRQAMTKAGARGDELPELWNESMESLRRYSSRWALYLTPTGLAVFGKGWSSRAFNNITVNPIILPYRELEPFMKPGPWRDELLK